MLLDGCSIHHNAEVLAAVHEIGAMVLYLEPYDPQHMPIELGFRSVKDYLRKNRDILRGMELKDQLEHAVLAVSSFGLGRAAFGACGYPVS